MPPVFTHQLHADRHQPPHNHSRQTRAAEVLLRLRHEREPALRATAAFRVEAAAGDAGGAAVCMLLLDGGDFALATK